LSQLVVDWQVITADVVEFDAPAAAFDRVMSIEMFEHMKNYGVSSVGLADLCLPIAAGDMLGDGFDTLAVTCRCSWGASASG
jgi:hypothetical protein